MMNTVAYMARIAGRSVGLGTAVAGSTSSGSCSTGDSCTAQANQFGGRWRHHERRWGTPAITLYQLTDRLHDGHIARVPGDEIAATVSAWLAELDAHSPLADDLARAVRGGDWPATYAISEHLSVDVTICA